MVTLLLFLAVLSSAQAGTRPTQPDFSGEWVLMKPQNPAADVATSLSVQQPVINKTARGEAMPPAYLELIVARHLPGGVRSERYRIGIAGGRVSGVPMPTSGAPASTSVQTRESVTWVGKSLVIDTSRWSGPLGELRLDEQRIETWEFDSEGRLVVTMTEQKGNVEPRTTTLTYQKSAKV